MSDFEEGIKKEYDSVWKDVVREMLDNPRLGILAVSEEGKILSMRLDFSEIPEEDKRLLGALVADESDDEEETS